MKSSFFNGVENHARNHLFAARQAQRDVEDGKAVREVGGAVERIDKPRVLRWRRVSAALFRHNPVRREVGAEPFDDELFRRAVGFRDQVELAFALKGYPAFVVVGHQRAGFLRDLDRLFEVRRYSNGA